MTQQEFNDKYKQYIPQGWGGLEFDIYRVTRFLDLIMEDMIQIPGFELQQIKLKFNWPRFYFTTGFKNKVLELAITVRVQEEINKLLRDIEEEELNKRMDIIGQNGNEGTHYDEGWMELEYYDEYQKTLATGMFFEWFPNLTGEWKEDKYAFCHEKRFGKK